MEDPSNTAAMKAFNSFVKTGNIRPESKNWCISAISPFIDTAPINIQGYPDLSTQLSVVKVINKAADYSVPVGIPGNWDLMFFFWPFLKTTNVDLVPFVSPNVVVPQVGALGYIAGGVTAYAVPSGTPFTIANAIGNIAITNNDVPNDQEFRLIAGGFETRNTTAEIYKQGTIYCCDVPNEPFASSVPYWLRNVPVNTLSGVMFGPHLGGVPTTSQEVMLYPGAVTWKASEGSYSVFKRNDFSNSYADNSNCSFIANGTNTPAGFVITPIFVSNAVDTVGSSMMTPLINYNSNVVMFKGLSNQSTISINVRFIVEIAPDQRSDLLPLAKTPCPYDIDAIEAVSFALAKMPPACVVSGNDLGSWLASGANAISSYFGLPPLGTIAKSILNLPMPGDKQQNNQKKKNNNAQRRSMASGNVNRARNRRGPQRQRTDAEIKLLLDETRKEREELEKVIDKSKAALNNRNNNNGRNQK